MFFPLLCCRKIKLCDFQYKLISFHFKHRLISRETHCCHDNTTVEECLLKVGLKSIGDFSFSAEIIVNCQSRLYRKFQQHGRGFDFPHELHCSNTMYWNMKDILISTEDVILSSIKCIFFKNLPENLEP